MENRPEDPSFAMQLAGKSPGQIFFEAAARANAGP